MVKGKDNIPSELTELPLAFNIRLAAGQDSDRISSRCRTLGCNQGQYLISAGRDIYFSPTVGEGNSGGPIIQNGKVIGLVGAGGQFIGQGVTARSIEDYIDGFGITLQDAASANVAEAPSTTTAHTKPETAETAFDREIVGKDGAPMALIPAGEFWMGSPDSEGDKSEHPRHRVTWILIT